MVSDPSVDVIRSNRPFGWYWFGQTMSSGGAQVTTIALPLVTALLLHEGPGALGAVATAGMLPYLLFSLIAGHLLEKRDKPLVTIPAHLIQGALALAVPAAWWLGILSVPLLAVIAFLSGTAALVFGIAGFAYVPQLVARDELPAANRAVQGSRTVTEIAGPGIAGALIGAVGPALAMIVDGIGYLTSAAGVAKGKPQHPPAPVDTEPDDATSIWTSMGILFGNTYLRSLTVHAALYNLAEAVFSLNLVLWAVQSQ